MRYLMGIDNGGTFVKAAIFDEKGVQLSVAGVPLETLTPSPGFTERDMGELWRANIEAIKSAIVKSGVTPADIVGISFSGHGKGLYLVDKNGEPAYNGILSQDARAWEYIEKWKNDGTKGRVFKKSYQDILACQPVALLAWLRDNKPEVLKNSLYIFSVKDYIRFKLTGEAFGEYTDFSGGNLLNLSTKEYDRELLDYFGLEQFFDLLPPLKYSADIGGSITEEAAAFTSLQPGTPAAVGMFDVDACGIASGLSDENAMCMIAGTWSINEYLSRKPVTNGSVALNSMFCIPGYYLIEESSPTSAGNLEWFVKRLMVGCGKSGKSAYAEADALVEAIEPEDSNVIFLPFLNGSNEDPLAKAAWIGLSAFHESKHMLRAVYEGVVFSHFTHVNKLLQNRKSPKSIRLSGGAANSDVWVQMFADVLQIPIDVTAEKEIGCLGAAIVAGIAAGVYKDYNEAIEQTCSITRTVHPRKEYAELYREKYAAYRAVVEALNGIWRYLINREID